MRGDEVKLSNGLVGDAILSSEVIVASGGDTVSLKLPDVLPETRVVLVVVMVRH
jgi:hypothetical protein